MTPAFVKKASASVFEVRALADEKAEDLRFIDLTDPGAAETERRIASSPQIDAQEKLIFDRQIQNCRRRGELKNCVLFTTIEKATGFLAGDGRTLWTNAHVVDRFVRLRAGLADQTPATYLEADGRIAVFLFDARGTMVFDPFLEESRISITEPPTIAARVSQSWYAEDSDVVGVALPRDLGEPIPIGASPEPGALLYRPGYAGCTNCAENPNQTDPLDNQDRGSGRNSDGRSLYWSSGSLQSLTEVKSYLEFGLIAEVYDLARMIFFSADAQVGFSGSPILNARGEVVGIMAGSKPKMYGNIMLNLSRGVRPRFSDRAMRH